MAIISLALLFEACSVSSENGAPPVVEDIGAINLFERETQTIQIRIQDDLDRTLTFELVNTMSGLQTEARPDWENARLEFNLTALELSDTETGELKLIVTDSSGLTTVRTYPVTITAYAELNDVAFADSGMKSCIDNARTLNEMQNANDPTIQKWRDVMDITELDCIDVPVNDLTGLGELRALRSFFVGSETELSELTDISALADLPELRTLYLYGNKVENLDVLALLPFLNSIHLSNMPNADVSSLASVADLTFLHLINVPAFNLDFLQNLPVKSLLLDGNGLTSVDTLSSKVDMEELRIYNNEITDISALAPLVNLSLFKVVGVPLTNADVLANWTKVEILKLFRTDITDVSSLRFMTSLKGLSLGRSDITNIDVLTELPLLEEMVYADLSISDLSVFERMSALKILEFADADDLNYEVFSNLTGLLTLSLELKPAHFSCADLASLKASLTNTNVNSTLECEPL
ncbi:MAG: hypothetical protein H6999_04225 [Hahellaceae bacterium]|nr:hypothetical protein [Hahellaceae bacterium]